jgi:predicted transcriptional regulator YheO
MESGNRKSLFEFLRRLTDGLADAIGRNCEIVLHDFSDPEHSIIAIANGEVTGRSVGDTLDVLGLQLLKHAPAADLMNYQTKTKAGKILRSSSIFLRDEKGEIFGSVCINFDISGALKAQEFLRGIVHSEGSAVEEEFEHTVEEVLGRLMQNAISVTGKSPLDLNRDEKKSVIAHLESRGAFLIRYSIDRAAELLGISKYTIYNYLEEIKSGQAAVELADAKSTNKN